MKRPTDRSHWLDCLHSSARFLEGQEPYLHRRASIHCRSLQATHLLTALGVHLQPLCLPTLQSDGMIHQLNRRWCLGRWLDQGKDLHWVRLPLEHMLA